MEGASPVLCETLPVRVVLQDRGWSDGVEDRWIDVDQTAIPEDQETLQVRRHERDAVRGPHGHLPGEDLHRPGGDLLRVSSDGHPGALPEEAPRPEEQVHRRRRQK